MKLSTTTEATVLLIDDEADLLKGMTRSLGRRLEGVTFTTACGGLQGLEYCQHHHFDVVLLDIQMNDINGMKVLEHIQAMDNTPTIIMMTAYGSIELAVEAMHKGAWDFVTKPINLDNLARLLIKAIERSRLIQNNQELIQQLQQSGASLGFVGDSKVMRQLRNTIATLAASDYTVLIRGESGTGKEIAAHMIHAMSPRRDKPFIMVNCPAIPEHLLESELFGHRKGAFTGAGNDHDGMFVQAEAGTICLDEIGDISVPIQTKLLRVLQNKEIHVLGSGATQPVDVRIVASTNQNLEEKIKDGSFRQDLYYRLNVVTIETPRLESIRQDIPLLAESFLQQTCAELQCGVKTLSMAAVEELSHRSWPGNARQLQNMIRRAAIFSKGETIGPQHFLPSGAAGEKEKSNTEPLYQAPEGPYKTVKEAHIDAFTRRYVTGILEKTEGNISEAARQAGLTRAALQKMMKRQGISGEQFRR
ncbi:MAG: sigma-54-dependent transcriptional regulator [Desulfopila sp.]